MPLVPAKCTSCGATLTLDPSQDAALCPFCNTPFIVEKTINNYTTVNNYNTTQNITAENVIVQADTREELFKAANTLLDLHELDAAFLKFTEMTVKFPDDWRGWWNLYLYDHSYGMLSKVRNGQNALRLAPANQKEELYQRIEQYLKRRRDQLAEDLDRLQSEKTAALEDREKTIKGIYRERDEAKARLDAIDARIAEIDAQHQSMGMKHTISSFFFTDKLSVERGKLVDERKLVSQRHTKANNEAYDDYNRFSFDNRLELKKLDDKISSKKAEIESCGKYLAETAALLGK